MNTGMTFMDMRWVDELVDVSGIEILLIGGNEEERASFAPAFLGLLWAEDGEHAHAVYSKDRILHIYMDRDGMDYESACEFFEFNVEGAYLGEWMPLYIDTGEFFQQGSIEWLGL